MKNEAKETSETGNDLVTELLLQYAFFSVFASRKGSKAVH